MPAQAGTQTSINSGTIEAWLDPGLRRDDGVFTLCWLWIPEAESPKPRKQIATLQGVASMPTWR
jgi:hypothetical protein